MDVHIFACDSPYDRAFVEFMNRNFPEAQGETAFVAMRPKADVAFPLPEQDNILYLDGGDFGKYKIIYDLMGQADRVFAHSLFEPGLSFFAEYPGRKKFIYIPWGSDIAPFIFRSYEDRFEARDRTFFFGAGPRLGATTFAEVKAEWETWRKMNLAVANMAATSGGELEAGALNHAFGKSLKSLPFLYYNPTDFSLLDQNALPANPAYHFKKRFPRVFMLNHSANPSNNHISLIDALAGLERDDFGVVAPLSYGGEPTVVELIAKYGQEKLGDRFCPIHEYLPPDQYAAVLRQVDVLLVNTIYSGAMANITAMLHRGGRVFMNARNTATIGGFKASGIDLGVIDVSDPANGWLEGLFTDCTEAEKAGNREKVGALASEARVVGYYADMLKQSVGLC